MDILKRDLAPVTDGAWEAIEEEAKLVLAPCLSARQLVSVSEPAGPDLAAVNLGRLHVPERATEGPVRWGLRSVLPLVEARASFELDVWELDNVDRGATDLDLDDLRRAARELARFEETAVYEGIDDGGIEGLIGTAGHEPVVVTDDPTSLPEEVTHAFEQLRDAAVSGPYALALGPDLHGRLHAESEQGYPVLRHVESLIGGPIVLAPFLDGGVLLSRRGGDTELTLGQDISIGYEAHEGRTVRLYFTESFAFRLLSPEVVVPIRSAA